MVGSENQKYVLTAEDYSGTSPGNGLDDSSRDDGFYYPTEQHHNGRKFSTKDNDKINKCAERSRGGWWYDRCYIANLNGVYSARDDTGILWYTRQRHTYLNNSLTQRHLYLAHFWAS